MAFIKKVKNKGKMYYYKVKSVRVGSKVKHEILEYYGSQPPGKVAVERAFTLTKTIAALDVGHGLAMYRVLKDHGFVEVINNKYSKRQGNDAGTVLFLTGIHKLFDEHASLNNLQDWIKTTPLQYILGLSVAALTPSNINYLFDRFMDKPKYVHPLEELQLELFNIVEQAFQFKEKHFYYDITHAYFEGKQCELANYGYAPDGKKNRKQINIGLVLTKNQHFPVFTKVFSGNLSDKKTVIEIATTMKYIYHFEHLILVMDRGMASQQNIEVLDANKYKYIIGLPATSKVVQRLRDTVSKHIIQRKGTAFKTKKGTIIHAMNSTKNVFGKRRFLIILYNDDKAQEQIEGMEMAIANAEQLFKETQNFTKKTIEDIQNTGNSYVQVVKKHKFQLQVNEEKKAMLKKRAGKTVLLTNLKQPPEKIAQEYYAKDAIEKTFRFSKQYACLRPIQRRLADRVRIDILLSFLGYYLIALVRTTLQQKGYDITCEALMKELPRIKGVIRVHTKKNTKHTEIITQNKTQQTLAKAFDMQKTFKELCS